MSFKGYKHTEDVKKKISITKTGSHYPSRAKQVIVNKECECGCGRIPKFKGSKYIAGHWAKVHQTKTKIIVLARPCECGCGKDAKSGNRFINRHNLKGGHTSPEHRRKISESNKGKRRSEETKKQMSESAKKAWAEGRQTWNESRKQSHLQPELKQLRREIALRNWANGVYDPGFALKYSSYEMMLAPLVKPLGFIATYVHPFRITCKDRTRLPDFVNPETKEIIELFGTWWHRDKVLPNGQQHETPEYVIEKYAEVGYKCRIVWIEEEFDNFVQEIKVNGTVLIKKATYL